jgi:hypothetical protein
MIFSDLGQAFDNLRAQKTRTMLTALGIVFGVGSVIGMLAIGAGAREALSPRRGLHPARVLPKPSREIPELYGGRSARWASNSTAATS